MGAAHKLRANQCILGAENRGINCLQRITAEVVIAVTGARRKMCFTDAMLSQRIEYLHLVVLGNRIDFSKARLALRLCLLSQLHDSLRQSRRTVNIMEALFKVLAHSVSSLLSRTRRSMSSSIASSEA